MPTPTNADLHVMLDEIKRINSEVTVRVLDALLRIAIRHNDRLDNIEDSTDIDADESEDD